MSTTAEKIPIATTTAAQRQAAQAHVDHLLLALDPDAGMLQIGNQLAGAARDPQVNKAMTLLHSWVSAPIAFSELGSLQRAPIQNRISGLHPVLANTFFAGYSRAREALKTPGAYQKILQTVQPGGGLLELAQKFSKTVEPAFRVQLVRETESRALGNPRFFSQLTDASETARDVVYRFPNIPVHHGALKPFLQGPGGGDGDPSGDGGPTGDQSISICSIPSGSTAGDILCAVAVVVVIVILVAVK